VTSLRFVRVLVVGGVVTACALAWPRLARADSCAETEYNATVRRSTVTVSLGGGCGDGTVLLRQDEATGAVVEVQACSGADYVDECVPPGTYRYGPATELACSCVAAVPIFAEARVTAPADPACTPSGKASRPTSAAPPWGNGSGGSTKSCPRGCAVSSPEAMRVYAVQGFAVAAGLLGMGVVRRRRRRAAEKPGA